MVFRFLLLSDEVDDFKREIQIDSEATFLDLHNAILDSVGYTKDQMALCKSRKTKWLLFSFVRMTGVKRPKLPW